jgi:hypothetical protein
MRWGRTATGFGRVHGPETSRARALPAIAFTAATWAGPERSASSRATWISAPLSTSHARPSGMPSVVAGSRRRSTPALR